MSTKALNIDTKRLPPTPQWSPILSHSSLSSPRSSGAATDDDLSSRCRKLARSYGETAVLDDPLFECTSPRTPSRSRENSNEHAAPASPLSPSDFRGGGRHSHHHLPMSPPTPEGAHVLQEIVEEENESLSTPQDEPCEQEKSLGSSVESAEEPMQFHLSPPATGGHMSLHGASLALEELSASGPLPASSQGGLGLNLHEQFMMDNLHQHDETVGDSVENLRHELDKAQSWLSIDVSLVDGELLVGSPQTQLDPARTLSTVYIDPLLSILEDAYSSPPASPHSPHHRRLSFPSAPSTSQSQKNIPSVAHPLYLAIKIHSSLPITLQFLQASLQPVHDNQFLTSYCRNAALTTKAPIAVIVSSASGCITDEDLDNLSSPRIMYRAVSLNEYVEKRGKGIDKHLHPVVTGSYEQIVRNSQSLTDECKATIKNQVDDLHAKGLLFQIEGVPRFPEHTRRQLGTSLRTLGVDFVSLP
ncbi:uncharacterized protein JCM15063_006062 [Sporobolomyces koalae]|uniref:uncharacterized protein n=1 Tax=Sporobolomyces koalae TaxID=500713 RepID=UPI00317FAF6D